VDVTFGSASKIYADKVLSMVLTGMGADGREGGRMLKAAGSTIWAQDEESCVVYGMPQAVAKAGISSEDLPLDRIAERMLVEVGMA
ncbi:chemotaxis protein CheB, partial [Vibrio campbellii]